MISVTPSIDQNHRVMYQKTCECLLFKGFYHMELGWCEAATPDPAGLFGVVGYNIE